MPKSLARVPSIVLVLTLAFAVAMVPQFSRVTPAAAQTGTGLQQICGPVVSYQAATSGAAGSVVIGTTTIAIPAGLVVNNDTIATTGANVCFQYNVGTGGAITNASFVAMQTGLQTLCGTISAFTAPTSGAAGSVTINGTTIVIPSGLVINGVASATVGANVCFQYNVGTGGTITNAAFVANVVTPIVICGPVTAFTAATATAAGSLVIGGITVTIPVGSAVFATAPTVGQTQAISLTINGAGQILSSSVAAGTCTGTTVQGTCASFTAPTATTAGSVTIGTTVFPIAAGTAITGCTAIPLAAISVTRSSGAPTRLHLARGG